MAQSVWFLNRTSTVLYHESRKLFHTVSNLTMAHGLHGSDGSFLTWSLRILHFCYNEYRLPLEQWKYKNRET